MREFAHFSKLPINCLLKRRKKGMKIQPFKQIHDLAKGKIAMTHIDHTTELKSTHKTEGTPRLAKGLRMMELNGSAHRTITSTRPNIDTPLTHPKKGSGHHKIRDIFGKKSYSYNDALTSAYMILQKKANEQKKNTVFITVTLNDEINLKLREQDLDDAKETMIRSVSRWFRAYNYIADAIVALEECSNSFVEYENSIYSRLHLHIVTILNDNELIMTQNEFLKDKRMQIKVQDTWTDKRPYTDDDEFEEEEFGLIPFNAIDPDDDYWLNTYVKETVNKTTGEITKNVHRELPVCLRGVDYITKGIQKSIGRGKNHTLIGLKGHKELRDKLAKHGSELLAE